MKKMKKWIFNLFKIDFCKACGSIDLTHSSFWNGGYNYLCKQALGRSGTRCFDCGKMVWDESDDDFESHLPDWCKSHRQIINLES